MQVFPADRLHRREIVTFRYSRIRRVSSIQPNFSFLSSKTNLNWRTITQRTPTFRSLVFKLKSEHILFQNLARRDWRRAEKKSSKIFSCFVKEIYERQSHSLPTLSCFSVRNAPVCCLRIWCSPRYQRISPLHLEFRTPLTSS